MASARILVAGATGRSGREVVRELKERGHFVRALGRDEARLRRFASPADELVALGNPARPFDDGLNQACAGIDTVVSCMGASVIPSIRFGTDSFCHVDTPLNRKLIDAACSEGARHFLYLSVFTDGRMGSNGFVRAHETVVDWLRDSELTYIVVRPTGFFSSLVQIMSESCWGLLPEARGGAARTNPIHEADLASYCADLICGEASGEFQVGGPEILTRREIAEIMSRRELVRKRVHRVPVVTLSAAALALGPANRRVSELLHFIAGVLSHDFVAPAFGTRTLSSYVGLTA